MNRSNTPLSLQEKMDQALQLYNSANRSSFNKITFHLELDACLRWCSLLVEQNDAKVHINLFFYLFIYLFIL